MRQIKSRQDILTWDHPYLERVSFLCWWIICNIIYPNNKPSGEDLDKYFQIAASKVWISTLTLMVDKPYLKKP